MADGDSLPLEALVLRLPTVNQVHVSGEQRQPKPDAFALSPKERELRDAGQRVSVSVWDRAKITVAHARAQRGAHVAVEAYELPVFRVRHIAATLEHVGLDVVEDPAGAVGAPAEVQAAHAGILGLDAAPPGHPSPKKLLKDAREALARACRGPVE